MNTNTNQPITIDHKIRFGKPTIAGTRTPVELVIGKIAGGMEISEIMKEYDLTKEQIYAALRYASAVVSQEYYLGS